MRNQYRSHSHFHSSQKIKNKNKNKNKNNYQSDSKFYRFIIEDDLRTNPLGYLSPSQRRSISLQIK
ncbi:hypothetical protein ACOSB0_00140, partial [Candidatus Phytoplasma citri]